ncbi:60S ribosomal protein l36-1, partial [Phtheirospermum japonicum]
NKQEGSFSKEPHQRLLVLLFTRRRSLSLLRSARTNVLSRWPRRNWDPQEGHEEERGHVRCFS